MLHDDLPDLSAFTGPLAGQVIAVTRAEQGYGRLVSVILAAAGANVILVGENAEALSAVASTIERQGQVLIPLSADVTGPLDWLSAQERILDIFGVLHGVVHLADKRTQTSFLSISENEWAELFNHNVKSSVGIAQTLARRLPDTWLTLIGPPLDTPLLQAAPQRGALEGLTRQAHSAHLRTNLLLPARAACGEELLDEPLAEAVLALASQALSRLRGNILEVPLDGAPKVRPSELSWQLMADN